MKTTSIHFVILKELKEELEKEAKDKNLSLSSYIKLILSERKK